IDENGWPAHKRTARHVTTMMTILQVHNMLTPDKAIILDGIPSYGDLMDNGMGQYFADPDASPAERVFFD
ncbi:MAG TPA: succinylglutamate desuccinylase, partial [Aminivibrio sp.]|nr:succinylglutamate desuccinylase [Aminivibrio sp.]